MRLPILLLLLLVSLAVMAGNGEYDQHSIRPLRQFVVSLAGYEQQFRHLLALRERIETRRRKLGRQYRILGREQQLRRDDRRKLDKTAYAREWEQSGRSRQLDQAITDFKRRVADYNRELRIHNDLARALMPFLKKRSPAQVNKLIGQIAKLRGKLEELLAEQRYARAAFLAENSALARELGYQPR